MHARESGTQAGDRALLSRPLLLPRAHPAQLSAKQLQRMSVKCEKDSKAEKGKIKKDIQKGNLEGARIHAENSIRQHMQSLNFLRMSSRIDAVSQRVETALRTQQVTKSMAGVVRAMDSAAAAMNLEQARARQEEGRGQERRRGRLTRTFCACACR